MNITEQAAKELKKALDEFDTPGAGIHIYSTQGCCGPSISMDIAIKPSVNETVVNMDNIDFYIENELMPRLVPVTIEYVTSGFQLAGLKRNSSCCG